MKLWLAKLISESGDASAKRFVLILAGVCMSISVVILAIASVYGKDVSSALNAVTIPLAAMCGVSYVGGKAVESANV